MDKAGFTKGDYTKGDGILKGVNIQKGGKGRGVNRRDTVKVHLVYHSGEY